MRETSSETSQRFTHSSLPGARPAKSEFLGAAGAPYGAVAMRPLEFV